MKNFICALTIHVENLLIFYEQNLTIYIALNFMYFLRFLAIKTGLKIFIFKIMTLLLLLRYNILPFLPYVAFRRCLIREIK